MRRRKAAAARNYNRDKHLKGYFDATNYDQVRFDQFGGRRCSFAEVFALTFSAGRNYSFHGLYRLRHDPRSSSGKYKCRFQQVFRFRLIVWNLRIGFFCRLWGRHRLRQLWNRFEFRLRIESKLWIRIQWQLWFIKHRFQYRFWQYWFGLQQLQHWLRIHVGLRLYFWLVQHGFGL
jgi:hypothetical protein